MMIKATDALVAVLALHGMLRHLRITNPALFCLFSFWSRFLPHRLCIAIIGFVTGIEYISFVFNDSFRSLIHEGFAQVHVHGIDRQHAHAVIEDDRNGQVEKGR